MTTYSHLGRTPQLVCFSHLRWDFVYQRPQHVLTRLARHLPVLYWEEPLFDGAEDAYVETRTVEPDLVVAVPHLPEGLSDAQITARLKDLLDSTLAERGPVAVRWYYSPMMLAFSRHIEADRTVYDCMDELSNFRFAPPDLRARERELFGLADVVFTGGYSLYEAKRSLHNNIHPFPSSVDVDHFRAARALAKGQVRERPRLGFIGVIDERMDLDLVAALAEAKPDWDFELVGPVVKIDPDSLPRAANLIYPGSACYDELPAILARWDVALMPFAINDATRFISPTKTPEYLAAGRPVVSTPITDVVRHYGALEGVGIASGADDFAAACEDALALARGDGSWLDAIDAALSAQSWDRTVAAMWEQIAVAATVTPLPQKPRRRHYDVLVIGAGFAGSVMAERLARDAGLNVLVVDRRPHIAGNAFDRRDDAGILIHQYGPHIFHTNSTDIVEYLSAFTDWRPYEHRVLGEVDGMLVPIPINRTTLNALYGLELESDADAAAFLASRAQPVDPVRTSEDVVVSAIGRELYEKFFRGYTRKQWALDPSELDKSVTARVPTRTNTDDRYFTDSFQAMPADGYTAMFEKMLDHPRIELLLGTEWADIRNRVSADEIVYTGPIDEYFGCRYGPLPYRSLRFEHQTHDVEQYQAVGTVNYPDESVPYTRVSEYKHMTGQQALVTSITYEYPADEGDPYYPIPRPENRELYKRYEALAKEAEGVTFVGRLATYQYYNMDQVVGQALASYRRLKLRLDAAAATLQRVDESA